MRTFAVLLTSLAPWLGLAASSCPPDAVQLRDSAMRSHVSHIEPLQLPGIRDALHLQSVVEARIGFDKTGKLIQARAISGHPLAIASFMESAPKWRLIPAGTKRKPKGGCGVVRVNIRFDGGTVTAALE